MSDGLDLTAIRARAEADLLRRVVQGETSVVDPATTLALVDELEQLRAKIAETACDCDCDDSVDWTTSPLVITNPFGDNDNPPVVIA